jgi:hypothetical protein
MYVRLATWANATNIEGGIDYLRGTLPLFRQQSGYLGLLSSVDRTNGTLSALSMWETESDCDASESSMKKARDEVVEIIGGTMRLERFEQMVAEVVAAPVPGTALMVTPFSMDPAKIDENIVFFMSEIVPAIKAAPGFCTLRNMVNRQTGEGYTGTIWVDHDAMEAQVAGSATRREMARRRGITFGEISFREIVLIDRP